MTARCEYMSSESQHVLSGTGYDNEVMMTRISKELIKI